MADLVDKEKELERLNKELVRLQNEVERSNKMLNNPSFIDKAPAQKVQTEREKLEKYILQLKEVEQQIASLEGMYE